MFFVITLNVVVWKLRLEPARNRKEKLDDIMLFIFHIARNMFFSLNLKFSFISFSSIEHN